MAADGTRVIAPLFYAAEAAALCVLEFRVHLDLPPDLLPDDYVLMAIDIGEAAIEALEAAPDDARGYGDDWLRAMRTPLLRVPSFIVQEIVNLLIIPPIPAQRLCPSCIAGRSASTNGSGQPADGARPGARSATD